MNPNHDKDLVINILQSVIRNYERKVGEMHSELFEMSAKEDLLMQKIQELEHKIAELGESDGNEGE